MEKDNRMKPIFILALLLWATCQNAALAQKANPYEPLGIEMGSFILSPQLNLVNQFDSNIYRTENGEQSDYILHIEPSFNLSSNWNRHALDLSIRGDIQYYADHSSENKQNYFIDLAGRLDVLRHSFATTKFYHSRQTEMRGTVEGSGQTEPVEYFTTGGFLGYEHKFNRLRVNLFNDVKYLDYENGVSTTTGTAVNNDARDRYYNVSELRLGYEFNPNFEAFVRGAYTIVEYDRKFDINGLQRSSTGWDGSAGIRLDFTGKLTGEAHVGYMQRDYDDPSLNTIDGMSGGLGLKWYATGLTTLSAMIDRAIKETTQIGQSGFFDTSFILNVDHELLRNVLLHADAGYVNREYEGKGNPGLPSREEDIYRFGFNAKYLFNRNLYLIGGYDYENRNTNIPNNDYQDHRVELTIGAQL
ncbi:MAG: outer membrane beta-barrel protein [Gammaproteobacteria bacterium]